MLRNIEAAPRHLSERLRQTEGNTNTHRPTPPEGDMIGPCVLRPPRWHWHKGSDHYHYPLTTCQGVPSQASIFWRHAALAWLADKTSRLQNLTRTSLIRIKEGPHVVARKLAARVVASASQAVGSQGLGLLFERQLEMQGCWDLEVSSGVVRRGLAYRSSIQDTGVDHGLTMPPAKNFIKRSQPRDWGWALSR